MRLEHATYTRDPPDASLYLRLTTLLLLLLRPGAGAAPPPFSGATSRQCLPLSEDLGPREACGPHVRLRFCDAYAPARLLQAGACGDGGALAGLRDKDEGARRAAARFRRLLDRYDCENAHSVSWTCRDCQSAYKAWVCAMFLPPLCAPGVGQGLKPCRHLCRRVEQRCPYFHPSVKDQYAGERVFKCIDPDIPDLEGQQQDSSYGPPHRCYCPRHLSADETDDEEADPECLPAPRRGGVSGAAPPPSLLLWLLCAALLRRRDDTS